MKVKLLYKRDYILDTAQSLAITAPVELDDMTADDISALFAATHQGTPKPVLVHVDILSWIFYQFYFLWVKLFKK